MSKIIICVITNGMTSCETAWLGITTYWGTVVVSLKLRPFTPLRQAIKNQFVVQ